MTSSSSQLEVLAISSFYASHGQEIEMMTETLIREIARREAIHFTWAATETPVLPEIVGQDFCPLPGNSFFDTAFGKPWPLWSKKAKALLREKMQAAHMVWIHGVLSPSLYRAFQMADKLKKPTIFTYQGGPVPKGRKLIDRRYTVPLLRDVSHAVFTSDKVGEDYYLRAGFTRPISIVPNGVDLRTFHAPLLETRRYLRQQFALKADQPILLYVGSFDSSKGLEVLRQMAERMPNWRFWLAGQGKIDPERWLLPNLHVFRDRQGATLAELYHTADLLLVPGSSQGFPRVIQEAMACGLPVMTSPEVAAGSRVATPYIHLAHVWPDDPGRTAGTWVQRLLDFPTQLPLQSPLYEIADFAQLTWEWAPIANVYAEIFRAQEQLSSAS